MSVYAKYLRPVFIWLGELVHPDIRKSQAARQAHLDISAAKLKELQKANRDFLYHLELFRQSRLANEDKETQNKHRLAANAAHHRFYQISAELDAMRPPSLRRNRA